MNSRRASSLEPSETICPPEQSVLSAQRLRTGKKRAMPGGIVTLRVSGLPVKFPPGTRPGPFVPRSR